MSEELELCPFCDGNSSIVNGGPGCKFVHCDVCGATTSDGTTEFAIAAWNRRAPSPATREAVEALEMLRDRILKNGDWDDGCFYYRGTSASELEEPLKLADAAIRSLTGAKP